MDDYYEVVLEEDLNKFYSTREDWKKFVQEKISAEHPGKGEMNVKDLNSVVNLIGKEDCMRKVLWRQILKKCNNSKSSLINETEDESGEKK